MARGVEAARQRRAAYAGTAAVHLESFIDDFARRTDLTMSQRASVVAKYLQDKITRNISVPVVKAPSPRTGHIMVVERSKPGEFPRADSSTLRRSIFWDAKQDGSRLSVFVGTPIGYAVPLELMMDRRFLTRTLDEERGTITRMLTGRIT